MDVEALEHILREDPDIIEFLPAESWDPKDVDYSKFGTRADGIKQIVGVFEEYLNSPYILFGSSSERERAEWEDSMFEKYGEDFWTFYRRNSLKGAALFNITSAADLFLILYKGERVEEMTSAVARLKSSIEPLIPIKRNFTPYEKLENAKQAKQEVYTFLSSVSEITTQE